MAILSSNVIVDVTENKMRIQNMRARCASLCMHNENVKVMTSLSISH
jgi:hypothetical protein